jgi:hypothetical protein
MRRARPVRSLLVVAARLVPAGALVVLSATPSQAVPTGALVMGPASASTVVATVVSGQQLQISNVDPTRPHTLSSSVVTVTVGVLSTAAPVITAPAGTVSFGTIDGATPVEITVL